jgi:hypothetical protein
MNRKQSLAISAAATKPPVNKRVSELIPRGPDPARLTRKQASETGVVVEELHKPVPVDDDEFMLEVRGRKVGLISKEEALAERAGASPANGKLHTRKRKTESQEELLDQLVGRVPDELASRSPIRSIVENRTRADSPTRNVDGTDAMIRETVSPLTIFVC